MCLNTELSHDSVSHLCLKEDFNFTFAKEKSADFIPSEARLVKQPFQAESLLLSSGWSRFAVGTEKQC